MENSFKKSNAQVRLEKILNLLVEKGILISQLKTFPAYAALSQIFDDDLADVINTLVHEEKTNKLITSFAHSENSRFDEERKEYDTLYKVISETYLGLYSVIKKSSNKGRIRIDTFLDKLSKNHQTKVASELIPSSTNVQNIVSVNYVRIFVTISF